MITGCKQMKGCITVKITNSVVNISMFGVLDVKWDSRKPNDNFINPLANNLAMMSYLKSTVPQKRPPPTPWNRNTMVKLITVRLKPFKLTLTTLDAKSCIDSLSVMK